MGCFSVKFIWAVVMHSLCALILVPNSYMICCSAQFVWAVVMHSFYMGCCNALIFYGLLQCTVLKLAVATHSLYGLL